MTSSSSETAWQRTEGRPGKKGGSWAHPSGWTVHHCGHPTALWPYYLRDPDGTMVVSHNGHGFVQRAWALEVAEGLHAGTYTATTDRCRPGLMRVLQVTAFRFCDWLPGPHLFAQKRKPHHTGA